MSDELRDTFFLECEDLLEVLESGLLDLSNGDGDDETVNAVFRAAHSIKGGAGAFGLEALVRFAHKFETALDEVREKRLEPSSDVIKVFLRSSDVLSDLVRAMRDETMVDDDAIAECTVELQNLIGDDAEEEEATFEAQALDFSLELDDIDGGGGFASDAPGQSSVGAELDAEIGGGTYSITFQPHHALYQRGNETTLILRALAALGDIDVECDVSGLPDLDNLAAEDATLVWRVRLETVATEEAISEIFEFVEDDCELSIENSESGSLANTEVMLPPDIATDEELRTEGVAGDGTSQSAKTTIDLVESDADPAKVATQAFTEIGSESKIANKPATKSTESPKQTVRVDLDRIERLINLVGELVINQAMLTQRFAESELAHQTEVAEGLDEFKMLTRDIQESVMAIRAQPVKPLFQRMTRIIREAANATGKSVRLISEGEGTEVDKTIVERLADPLTHMIRNAVDHGLESPEEREASGKPSEGVVRLIAGHRSGRIVIEVADDGAGINRAKVREIAISKGLIQEDAMLSDGEIDNLLFMPGFSTAKEVSDLSGRGVGMDVVKKAIQALGGRTSIASEPGKGTTFAISLPLTLAVLDGIVVSVADQTMVIPLTNIVETFRPGQGDVKGLGSAADVVLVRGQPLPIIDVGYNLGFRVSPLDWTDAVFIVTETHEGGQNALVVDEIFDQRQVVIKGLDANYGDIPGVAAATILGDGRIALILDVDVLVEEVTSGHTLQQIAMAG